MNINTSIVPITPLLIRPAAFGLAEKLLKKKGHFLDGNNYFLDENNYFLDENRVIFLKNSIFFIKNVQQSRVLVNDTSDLASTIFVAGPRNPIRTGHVRSIYEFFS